jgi:hypothetical protein
MREIDKDLLNAIRAYCYGFLVVTIIWLIIVMIFAAIPILMPKG